jgi:hypothetical protein
MLTHTVICWAITLVFHNDYNFNRRSQWARGLRLEPSSPAQTLECGFESHSRHGCLCAFILRLCRSVCRQRPCDGLIPLPRSPTYCVWD